MQIHTTTNIEEVARFIAEAILERLRQGIRVLFFVTGGSSIVVGVRIAEIFRTEPNQNIFKNLVVTLTDERYGKIEHKDSNWAQLIAAGFAINEAKLIPILVGDNMEGTVRNFSENLAREFQNAEYKIGLFGVGKDGHTAGILPESGAVYAEDLVYGYDSLMFYRITITSKAIEKLDEAVVFMQGIEKLKIVEDLKTNIEILKQPVQILKKVPVLTIFTDYEEGKI